MRLNIKYIVFALFSKKELKSSSKSHSGLFLYNITTFSRSSRLIQLYAVAPRSWLSTVPRPLVYVCLIVTPHKSTQQSEHWV